MNEIKFEWQKLYHSVAQVCYKSATKLFIQVD